MDKIVPTSRIGAANGAAKEARRPPALPSDWLQPDRRRKIQIADSVGLAQRAPPVRRNPYVVIARLPRQAGDAPRAIPRTQRLAETWSYSSRAVRGCAAQGGVLPDR